MDNTNRNKAKDLVNKINRKNKLVLNLGDDYFTVSKGLGRGYIVVYRITPGGKVVAHSFDKGITQAQIKIALDDGYGNPTWEKNEFVEREKPPPPSTSADTSGNRESDF